MGKIVAIGGGEIRDEETRAIDERLIELTGRARPNVLFIGTAGGDDPDFYQSFQSYFSKSLGCQTDVLPLLTKRPTTASIAHKIESADLIYVGGGNTLRMMKLWRRLGVDKLLEAAHQRGTVLSGISAGAICWFSAGLSDSRSFSGKDDWPYIRVRGLGLVNAIFCPHVDGEKRLSPFVDFMGKYGHMGLGCDNNCALEIIDGHYRFIASQPGAQGYRVYKQRGEVVTERLAPGERYLPLADLLAK